MLTTGRHKRTLEEVDDEILQTHELLDELLTEIYQLLNISTLTTGNDIISELNRKTSLVKRLEEKLQNLGIELAYLKE